MRILCVDPGEKRIGIALSDPSGTIATPLIVLNVVGRRTDAAAIATLVNEHQVEKVVIGQSLNDDGEPTYQGRRAERLAEELRLQTEVPVVLWDESFSTQDAREARIRLGVSRKKRSGHLDDRAAAIILQSYLDANDERSQNP